MRMLPITTRSGGIQMRNACFSFYHWWFPNLEWHSKMETTELVTNMCKEKRRRRQWSHTTIICSGLFNSDSPRGNFLFFFFIFKCYCICFSNQGQQFLYPTFKGLGMFWSHSIRTSCKMYCSHLVSVNLNIMQKVSCTQVPLLFFLKHGAKSPLSLQRLYK